MEIECDEITTVPLHSRKILISPQPDSDCYTIRGKCLKINKQLGEVLYLFSKHIRIKDSNEANVFAILEALCIYSNLFQDSLIVESD